MTRFRFDDGEVQAPAGMSVAAALMSAGVLRLRAAPGDASPRGAFCLMGVCQECLVEVDGGRVEACRLAVAEGLNVRSIASSG